MEVFEFLVKEKYSFSEHYCLCNIISPLGWRRKKILSILYTPDNGLKRVWSRIYWMSKSIKLLGLRAQPFYSTIICLETKTSGQKLVNVEEEYRREGRDKQGTDREGACSCLAQQYGKAEDNTAKSLTQICFVRCVSVAGIKGIQVFHLSFSWCTKPLSLFAHYFLEVPQRWALCLSGAPQTPGSYCL